MIAALLGSLSVLGPALRALPWMLAGLGVTGTLYYRERLSACQASVAIDAAKAAEKVAAAKEADAKFTRALEEQLQPLRDAIREQSHETIVALSKIRSNPACAATPAGRAFDSGVRPGGQQAGPGR